MLNIFPLPSMFSISTFPDYVDLTSVKGNASRTSKRPRSIDAPCFGKVCPTAVQKRALLRVSHFGDRASDFHCQAPKGIRDQLTSQSCHNTLSASVASAQVWTDLIDWSGFSFACLPTCLSGEHTPRGMDEAV